MTKLTIYRMEDAEGCGPWQSDAYYTCGPYAGTDLPPPYYDGPPIPAELRPDKHINCGAQSLALFRRWFNKRDREVLSKNGFSVHVYETEAPEWTGKHQVIFDKTKAKRIGALDPIALTPILTA